MKSTPATFFAPENVATVDFTALTGSPLEIELFHGIVSVRVHRGLWALHQQILVKRRGKQMIRPTPMDYEWMRVAIALAHQCPPSPSAYSVGAVIVDQDEEEISRGYSRETDSHVHAEESALAKLAHDDPRLRTATIYSTLEPCSQRKSRPRTCAQLILTAGIPRVVMAWREPDLFVADCQGYEMLTAAGVTVVEILDLAQEAKAPNSHLLLGFP